MATAQIKRRFRISGIQAIQLTTPGMGPGSGPGGVQVSAVPVEDDPAAAIQPPGGYTWPFADPDGSVAAFFVVNSIVELTFAAAPAPGA